MCSRATLQSPSRGAGRGGGRRPGQGVSLCGLCGSSEPTNQNKRRHVACGVDARVDACVDTSMYKLFDECKSAIPNSMCCAAPTTERPPKYVAVCWGRPRPVPPIHSWLGATPHKDPFPPLARLRAHRNIQRSTRKHTQHSPGNNEQHTTENMCPNTNLGNHRGFHRTNGNFYGARRHTSERARRRVRGRVNARITRPCRADTCKSAFMRARPPKGQRHVVEIAVGRSRPLFDKSVRHTTPQDKAQFNSLQILGRPRTFTP